MILTQATKLDEGRQRGCGFVADGEPARRLDDEEGQDDGDEGDEGLDEPGDLVLETLRRGKVDVAAVDHKDARHLGRQHGHVEPQRHQTTGHLGSNLDNGHGSHDGAGPYPQTREKTAEIQRAHVAVRQARDQRSDGVDALIDAEALDAAELVVEEKGQEGADAGAQIDKRDQVGNGGGVGCTGQIELGLERFQLRDRGSRSLVPSLRTSGEGEGADGQDQMVVEETCRGSFDGMVVFGDGEFADDVHAGDGLRRHWKERGSVRHRQSPTIII